MKITPTDLCSLLEIDFTDEQLETITADLEPAVIIAGAGTGKTTVMAARVVWLVANNLVRPDGVLGISFTRKATGELRQRVARSLARIGYLGEYGLPSVSTYDSFANRIVGEFGLLLGVDTDGSQLPEFGAQLLALEVVRNTELPLSEFLDRQRGSQGIASGIVSLSRELQSNLIDVNDARQAAMEHLEYVRSVSTAQTYLDPAVLRLEWLDLVEEYQALKEARGLREFDDYTAIAAKLAMQMPLVGQIMRDRYPVVLVDEYQDTSMAQVEMLKNLFSGANVKSGLGHPITAVGDPYQAIYTWRGAASNNISRFGLDFPLQSGDPARKYSLTENWRSHIPILEVANEVAIGLSEDGHAGVSLVGAEREEPCLIDIHFVDSWHDEQEWLANDLANLKDSGQIDQWRDAAVLVRNNSWGAEVYQFLLDREIPAQVLGLSGLLLVPEVADIWATIRLVVDPAANDAALRLLMGPRWAIGRGDIATLASIAKSMNRDGRRPPDESFEDAAWEAKSGSISEIASSLLEAAAVADDRFSPDTRERLRQFATEIRTLARRSSEPVLEFCRSVVAALNLREELTLAHGNIGTLQVEAFLAEVQAFADSVEQPTLRSFAEYLDIASRDMNGLGRVTESGVDAVQILTCHRAKGLEWECVYVPHLGDGQFPSTSLRGGDNWLKSGSVIPGFLRRDASAFPQIRQEGKKGLDEFAKDLKEYIARENRRLAYVSVTRAKRILRLSGHQYLNNGKPVIPSPYLVAAEDHRARVETRSSRVEEWSVAEPLDQSELVPEIEHHSWPKPYPVELFQVRQRARRLVLDPPAGLPLSAEEAALFRRWQDHTSAIEAEERAAAELARTVQLPDYLSATALLRANRDLVTFAQEIKRPMPRAKSVAARRGTRFHAWVESRFDQGMLADEDPVTEQPDPVFNELCARFEAGQFATRQPVAVEQPFTLMIDAVAVRGQIDAVFEESDGRYLVVDWKTGAAAKADPGQLEIYRRAWAELNQVPVENVKAAFYDVMSDNLLYHTSEDPCHLVDVFQESELSR